jgi:hypothetical protein
MLCHDELELGTPQLWINPARVGWVKRSEALPLVQNLTISEPISLPVFVGWVKRSEALRGPIHQSGGILPVELQIAVIASGRNDTDC